MNTRHTYISLFSSAGVGCYGFLQEGYSCIATVELIPRRLEVQKYNHKCELDSGYICGDLTKEDIKGKIFSELRKWKTSSSNKVDVLIATPPCQGISVINHKKKEEINRNSLVVESVELVKKIRPKVFIFENVQAFMKTYCINKNEEILPIGEHIHTSLGNHYIISSQVLNFMNYGSNSSRTRTLVIGVDKKYKDSFTPLDLFPNYSKEKTLRDVIGEFPSLKWGQISKNDFYHAFRIYDPRMRPWIHNLHEGESAFDNIRPENRPHRVIDGEIVENTNKNRDKYTRQIWDRFPQCIHTRNDQLAAQNTIHPNQDRVLSIRELMELMTIPQAFRWVNNDVDTLNLLPRKEKDKVYSENEVNIRQCIGEAVPTAIFRRLAANIKQKLDSHIYKTSELLQIIDRQHLSNVENLKSFLSHNELRIDVETQIRIAELANVKREQTEAYYTNKFIVNEIVGSLPFINAETIRILEPSVGAGSFLPLLIKKYQYADRLIIDVVDIDPDTLSILDIILSHLTIPQNVVINKFCQDFILYNVDYKYDICIGNPPFSKLSKKSKVQLSALRKLPNPDSSDLAEIFLQKCLLLGKCVSLVLNKNMLCSEDFSKVRGLLRKYSICRIIDFGRYGFPDVTIETICPIINTEIAPTLTKVYSLRTHSMIEQKQSYITDSSYPNFLIYRDSSFDNVAAKLTLGVFDCFRDRQITKKNTLKTSSENYIWVLKAKNIISDGSGVSHIEGYDLFIDSSILRTLNVYQYFNKKNVFLAPNMTYNTRVIRNINGVAFDGSVAILIPKKKCKISDRQLAFFSSEEFRHFYSVARNHSTQSINIDANSVYYFGTLNK